MHNDLLLNGVNDKKGNYELDLRRRLLIFASILIKSGLNSSLLPYTFLLFTFL